jgi:hypothetical protein
MSDEELIARLRALGRDFDDWDTAADRIEALTVEREFFEEEWVSAVDKLNKAVEALRGVMQHMPDYADTVWQDARATLAEIEGEKT